MNAIVKPWYATNARNLLQTRREGFAPNAPVSVALSGGKFADTALFVRPEMPAEKLDWRMLVNLDVWLWASPAIALQKVLENASRIAHARPSLLLLRFEHGDQIHDIEVGTGTHHPAVADMAAEHSFTWLPFNLGGTPTGQRLRDALRGVHKPWSNL
jgi:hypothetical protein